MTADSANPAGTGGLPTSGKGPPDTGEQATSATHKRGRPAKSKRKRKREPTPDDKYAELQRREAQPSRRPRHISETEQNDY